MKKSTKKLLVDWVLPIAIILILYVTGWYKPLAVGMQQALLATGLIKPSIELTEEKTFEKADYNWQLTALDGTSVSFAEFKGKVIFLNNFATWCPPCIAEMPGIQGLYDELQHDPNIVFLIISRDDSTDKVKKFMAKKGYSLPVYTSASRTPSMLHTNVLPTTYIIAADGPIVSSHEGMADYNNDKVISSLKKLAEQAPSSL